MEKTYKTLQIDEETHERLRRLAKNNERSMAAQLRWLINNALAETNLAAIYQMADKGISDV